MNRALVWIAALVAVGVGSGSAQAAAAQVWPSKARRLADGRVEYSYDLRALKAGKVVIDLGPDSDDAALKAFRKALPSETKVVVAPAKASLRLHAPGGLEPAPLATSFSRTSDRALAPDPFESRPRLTDVPAFHPDAPKLLVSADLLLWRQQRLLDEVEAGLLQALYFGGLSAGQKAVFQKIFEAAVARSKNSSGDAQAGARRLAARLAALMSLSSGRLPDAARVDPQIASRAEGEAQALSRPKPRFPPRPMYGWSRRLEEARTWALGLAAPFGTDREGVAAALTLLAIVEADPALAKQWAALGVERNRIFGSPSPDRLELIRKALGDGGAAGALEGMGELLARIGTDSLRDGEGAAPFAVAPTPAERFIAGLDGAEQLHAIEELTLAVQDGRVSLAAPADEGWCAGRDAWLRELLRPEANVGGRLEVTGDYKERLARTFQALYGLDGDIARGDSEALQEDEVGVARVRLMVPPLLELEPLPEAYLRAADAWSRLEAIAVADRSVARTHGVLPDGSARASTVAKDAAAEAKLLRGLAFAATVAAGGEPPASDADRALLKSAQRFLSSWRKDQALGQDVRYLLPVGEGLEQGMVVHSGVFGVGRRELEVAYDGAPEAVVSAKDPSLFETDTSAVQRYQIPVLVTGAVTVPRASPLGSREFRALCDQAGRTREAILSALPGALVHTMTPVSTDQP